MSELVREAIRHYQDLLAGPHLASTREAIAETGCKLLRPHFIGGDDYAQLIEVTTLLNRGVVTAADRLARDATLRRKVGIPEYMDALIELDREHGAPAVMARFDGLVDRNGLFQIIEYNSNPGFDDSLTSAFSALPLTVDFAKRYAFRTTTLSDRIFDALRGPDGAGSDGLPVIAIPVASLPASPEKYPRMRWVALAEARGARVVEATVDAFRHEGGRLIVGHGEGLPVDMLMPQWTDLADWAGSTSPVLDAIRAGSVRVLSGVSRGLLCGYKHTFELLSNPEYASMFEPAVAAALAKHVPWSRTVRNTKTAYRGKVVDLLPFVADNRERFVLKPSGGTGGDGVLIGPRCTDTVWKQTLKRALSQKYVVQERVLGAVESFPFAAPTGEGFALEPSTPTFEPFIWGGSQPADAIIRLSASGNHTFTEGGSPSALWIIEGAR